MYDIGEFSWPLGAVIESLDAALRMLAIWQTGAYHMKVNFDPAVLSAAEMGS